MKEKADCVDDYPRVWGRFGVFNDQPTMDHPLTGLISSVTEINEGFYETYEDIILRNIELNFSMFNVLYFSHKSNQCKPVII